MFVYQDFDNRMWDFGNGAQTSSLDVDKWSDK